MDYNNYKPEKPRRKRIFDPHSFVKAGVTIKDRTPSDDKEAEGGEKRVLRPRKKVIINNTLGFWEKNVDLYFRNTMKVHSKAKDFFTISSDNELITLHKMYYSKDNNLNGRKIVTLGEGSNTVFINNDTDSILVSLNLTGFHVTRSDENFVWVNCRAGVLFREFVVEMCKQNYSGLENLAAIYGTVGAAPVQNIGAYGAEIKDFIDSVRYFDVFSGDFHTISKEECCFSYRNSIFKQQTGNKIITDVVFKLNKQFTFNNSYAAVRSIFGAISPKVITPLLVADKLTELRHTKLPDPKVLGNCGSFFKNPVVEEQHFNNLSLIYPDIVAFDDEKGKKISAAWLIQKCGFKGKKNNRCGVYAKQPLVVVNYGVVSGKVIAEFAEEIIKTVSVRFGITLQTEPHYVY